MWVIGMSRRRAGTADLLRRRHDGLGVAEQLAHRVAARNVPERAVLELAGRADDGALAVTFDSRGAAPSIDQAPAISRPSGLRSSMKPLISST